MPLWLSRNGSETTEGRSFSKALAWVTLTTELALQDDTCGNKGPGFTLLWLSVSPEKR